MGATGSTAPAAVTGPPRSRPGRLGRPRRLLAALALLAVAGCGGAGGDDDAAPPGRGATPTVSPSAPPSLSASLSASAPAQAASAEPSTGPSSPAPRVSAADGGDVAACADGDCEIAVSGPVTIRVDGPAGPATLSVTEVGPNRIEYTVESGGSRSDNGASGPGQGCLTVLRPHGSGTSCGALGDAARPDPRSGAVVIQVLAGEDGTAIVRVVSG